METPTQEINRWIAEHGSTRDALNVALARLATVTAERNDAFNVGQALEAERDAVRAEALDAAKEAIYDALTVSDNPQFVRGVSVAMAEVDRLRAQPEPEAETDAKGGG